MKPHGEPLRGSFREHAEMLFYFCSCFAKAVWNWQKIMRTTSALRVFRAKKMIVSSHLSALQLRKKCCAAFRRFCSPINGLMEELCCFFVLFKGFLFWFLLLFRKCFLAIQPECDLMTDYQKNLPKILLFFRCSVCGGD